MIGKRKERNERVGNGHRNVFKVIVGHIKPQ